MQQRLLRLNVAHHDDAEAHQERRRDQDAGLCFCRESFLSDIGCQILFIQTCRFKPYAETFRGFPEAENRKQEKERSAAEAA